MPDITLAQKSCEPCKGGTPALSKKEAENFLKRLGDNWQLNGQGHLFKKYKVKDFSGALEFANKIGEIADKEGHHPDLYISWGKCAVEIWTHKINGLTESDFILAAKIETI